jgi:hypothetical protein
MDCGLPPVKAVTNLTLMEALFMFSDPLTLTLFGQTDDAVFQRVNQDGYSSVYRLVNATREARLTIRHSKTKATATRLAYDRHNVEIFDTVFATSSMPEYTRKVYAVAEQLPGDVGAPNLIVGLCSWLLSSSAAPVLKLRNWES